MNRNIFIFIFLYIFLIYRSVNCQNVGTCPLEQTLKPSTQDEKWTIFDQLTPDEVYDVMDFMVDDMGFFHFRNITEEDEGFFDLIPTPQGPNYVFRIELLEPIKEEVLNYLDKNGQKPDRYAKVIIVRGAENPRDIMEYKVGPLPLEIGNNRTIAENDINLSTREGVVVEKLVKDGEIPFSKRPAEPVSSSWEGDLVVDIAYQLKEIFLDTTGYCYGANFTLESEEEIEATIEECGFERIQWLSYPALDPDTSKRIFHTHWYFMPLRVGSVEMELHPVPVGFKIDVTDREEENWRAYDFDYCHQGPFGSVDELMTAYRGGILHKCISSDWKSPTYDESWSRTDIEEERTRAGTNRAGPRTFYPEGARYVIKENSEGSGFWFEWLGWQGHVSQRLATGISFHDLKFRNERIVYELSLQEQFVQYSGYGGSGQTLYLDSYYGLGTSTVSLRRGVDCPEQAEYLPYAKMHGDGYVEIAPDIYCVFEEDAQTTEWRHTHGGGIDGPHSDGIRRSNLVVRTIATIGNYDYLYDIKFKLDASIQVEVTMGGYMETTFYDINGYTDRDSVFATRVWEHTFANLHDHLSSWKVDLDVLGQKNSVHKTAVKVGTWEEAISEVDPEGDVPEWHEGDHVKYIHTEKQKTEFGSKITTPGAVVWTFTNDHEKNRWGVSRGYTIMHGLTTDQLLPDSHPLTKACAWSKYHLAVTKRKESELYSNAATYDMVAPGDPVVSLDDFLDGEYIVDEDIVAWVMTGVQHVPRSEDVPLISNFGTSFYIKPWNYFERLVSMDVNDKQDFNSCAPTVGNLYNYTWAGDMEGEHEDHEHDEHDDHEENGENDDHEENGENDDHEENGENDDHEENEDHEDHDDHQNAEPSEPSEPSVPNEAIAPSEPSEHQEPVVVDYNKNYIESSD